MVYWAHQTKVTRWKSLFIFTYPATGQILEIYNFDKFIS